MTIEILETLSDEYKPNQIFVAFWSNKRDQIVFRLSKGIRFSSSPLLTTHANF